MRLETKLKRFKTRLKDKKLLTKMRDNNISIRDIAKSLLGHPSAFRRNNNFLYHPVRDQLINYNIL